MTQWALPHIGIGGEIQKPYFFDKIQEELYSHHAKQEANDVDETPTDP
jgi:hypothetical protein